MGKVIELFPKEKDRNFEPLDQAAKRLIERLEIKRRAALYCEEGSSAKILRIKSAKAETLAS